MTTATSTVPCPAQRTLSAMDKAPPAGFVEIHQTADSPRDEAGIAEGLGNAYAALEQWKASNPWWRTAKNRELPQEFWDLRRRARNQKRTRRQKDNTRKRKAETQHLASSDGGPTQETKEEAAARKLRVKAHLAAQERLQTALHEGLRLVIDCSFVSHCNAREMRSLAKQMQLAVATNRKAPQPVSLTFTSFKGKLREFCQRMGGEAWPVNRLEQSTLEAFTAESLVMLTPDAAEPLEQLDPAKVYVIGGLVDRTPQKYITAQFSEKHKIVARRLPIAEQHFSTPDGQPMRDSNFILNVNDVAAALIAVHGGSTWAEALDAAIPVRKRKPAEQASSDKPCAVAADDQLGC